MSTSNTIEAVPLYVNPERVEEELAALGIGAEDALTPDKIAPFDQLHYHGTETVRLAAALLGLGPKSHVLDIGSGFGGPARHLAHSTGCRVTAIELQSAMHAAAVRLTERCGLSDRIEHICADPQFYPLPDGAFDAAVSWLTLVHIPERRRLLARLARALRAGGGLFLEDLVMRTPFKGQNLRDFEALQFAHSFTDIPAYEADLDAAGFRIVEAVNMTADWTEFTADRLVAFEADRCRYVAVHDLRTYDALHRFYAAVVRFYRSGSMGGVRIFARVGSSDDLSKIAR